MSLPPSSRRCESCVPSLLSSYHIRAHETHARAPASKLLAVTVSPLEALDAAVRSMGISVCRCQRPDVLVQTKETQQGDRSEHPGLCQPAMVLGPASRSVRAASTKENGAKYRLRLTDVATGRWRGRRGSNPRPPA